MTLPSLATLARRVLDDACVPVGAGIVVACSGGADSQGLLDVLAHIASPTRGKRVHAPPRIRLLACGVDHGLRDTAASELALAEELAHAHSVPFRYMRVSVAHGSNLQARARDARYAALREAARDHGMSLLATGHHLEDRAETVLIRILRGAPIAGLSVLAPASLDLLRPLIRAPRAQILSHVQGRRIPFAVDPSNSDRRHLRVRVREEVLPLLRSLDPAIDHHLVSLAEGAEHARVLLETAVWDREGRLVISGGTTRARSQ